MKKAVFILILASASLIILIFSVYLRFNDGKLHLVFCDVSQGDAIFIRTPKGTDILIDGGPDEAVLSCLSSHMPFWDRSIDAVILTHPHADHLTGLVHVIERYKVNAFFSEKVDADTEIYKLLSIKLAEKKVSAKDLYTLDNFKDASGLSLKTLWPTTEAIDQVDQNYANLDLNGLSLIHLLKYGDFSVLLTGDAGVVVEDRIAEEAGDVDVLKVPHHGSKTGMSELFLSIIKPEIGIISVGEENNYGHPAKISLDLLRKYRVKTFRTDLNGEIEILSDGSTWSVRTSRN